MRQPRMFDHNARRLALMGIAARSLAPVILDALNDDRVRDSLGDAYGSGRRLFSEVRGADPKDVVSRMARDAELQHELAAMVRTATRAVDEGVSATRRRLRRRVVLFVGIAGGIITAVGAQRRSRLRQTPEVHVHDAAHGTGPAVYDHGNAAPATATPATAKPGPQAFTDV